MQSSLCTSYRGPVSFGQAATDLRSGKNATKRGCGENNSAEISVSVRELH